MDEVQAGHSTYQMPPCEGFTIAHFLTVADLKRSAEFYKGENLVCFFARKIGGEPSREVASFERTPDSLLAGS